MRKNTKQGPRQVLTFAPIRVGDRGVAPGSQNLIHDGSFVNGIDGWYPTTEDTTLAHVSGTMTVDRGEGSNFTVHYIPDGLATIPLNGITAVDFLFDAWCAEADSVLLVGQIRFWLDAFQLTSVGSATQVPSPSATTLSANPQTFGIRNCAVPDGATHISVSFIGQTTTGHPISLTNIFINETAMPLTATAQPAIFPTRIGNGDFETDIEHWYGWASSETLSRETASPITGTGSLKVITPGGAASQGVIYTYDQQPFVLPGEDLQVGVTLRGAGTLKVQLWYNDGDDAIDVWTGTLSSTPTVIDQVVAMPPTEYVVPTSILIITTTDQAVTFYVDDVTLAASA